MTKQTMAIFRRQCPPQRREAWAVRMLARARNLNSD